MIRIKKSSLVCTSEAFPSQWDGRTDKHEEVYIRFRHAYLTIDIDDKQVFLYDRTDKPKEGVYLPLWFNGYGDGIMGIDEVIEITERESKNIKFYD